MHWLPSSRCAEQLVCRGDLEGCAGLAIRADLGPSLAQRLPGFSLMVRPAASQRSSPGRPPRAEVGSAGVGRRVLRKATKPQTISPTTTAMTGYVQGIHPAATRKAAMPAVMRSRAMRANRRDAMGEQSVRAKQIE